MRALWYSSTTGSQEERHKSSYRKGGGGWADATAVPPGGPHPGRYKEWLKQSLGRYKCYLDGDHAVRHLPNQPVKEEDVTASAEQQPTCMCNQPQKQKYPKSESNVILSTKDSRQEWFKSLGKHGGMGAGCGVALGMGLK